MKSFENTALEIIKTYIDMKERHASRTGMIFDPEYDCNISSPENMACTVNRLADTLAANYRQSSTMG